MKRPMETMYLYKLPEFIEGIVEKRPSGTCKSPYVADVISNNTHIIAHAPSLGCCGYVNKDQHIVMTIHEKPKLCTHVIHLAKRIEKNSSYLIGVHPKSAEKIVNICLEKGCIPNLDAISNIQREITFLNSRFDFVCRDKTGTQTIIEVKNVPCGDYEDIYDKDRKNKDYSKCDVYSKIAYFPDGYRKKQTDTVSPRALKHIEELEYLKSQCPTIRTIIIFVIQRPDCTGFQGSNVDPIYKTALNKAYHNGVEVIPIQISWNMNGECYFDKTLPFIT
tara:strand:+ start:13458 stop:14288 length:831 start_codon:yes stop_codon:yes gene_type:complete